VQRGTTWFLTGPYWAQTSWGVPNPGWGEVRFQVDRFQINSITSCLQDTRAKRFSCKTQQKNIPMSTQSSGKMQVLPPNTAGTCTPCCNQDGFSMASNRCMVRAQLPLFFRQPRNLLSVPRPQIPTPGRPPTFRNSKASMIFFQLSIHPPLATPNSFPAKQICLISNPHHPPASCIADGMRGCPPCP
jgi:hypothetical protein